MNNGIRLRLRSGVLGCAGNDGWRRRLRSELPRVGLRRIAVRWRSSSSRRPNLAVCLTVAFVLAVGNLTEAITPSGTTTYTYDLADRITSGAVPPTYDDNGNITNDGSYGGRSYTYDA